MPPYGANGSVRSSDAREASVEHNSKTAHLPGCRFKFFSYRGDCANCDLLWNSIYPPQLRQLTVVVKGRCRTSPMGRLSWTFRITFAAPTYSLIGGFGTTMGAKIRKKLFFAGGARVLPVADPTAMLSTLLPAKTMCILAMCARANGKA
jgi:hypothetical protein